MAEAFVEAKNAYLNFLRKYKIKVKFRVGSDVYASITVFFPMLIWYSRGRLITTSSTSAEASGIRTVILLNATPVRSEQEAVDHAESHLRTALVFGYGLGDKDLVAYEDEIYLITNLPKLIERLMMYVEVEQVDKHVYKIKNVGELAKILYLKYLPR